MAQQHLQAGSKVNLSPLGPGMAGARTTAIVKGRQLEVVRVVLQAGQHMKEHKAPGEMTVHCMEGCLEFRTPGVHHVLEPGDFIHLEAATPHSLLAVRDSSALVTMSIHVA
ncbi:cupin domain-containing protein [Rhodoferax sp.]|uniref:cupin domain-containing protein n=1 Tax=Rhodoferax sp. TaxID=50421 RepID=UPI0026154E86|nr:cupin domain-containing protein [Rhodoferax sp.]MDD2927214.1 cupin domain-containing protein [Rhodoferax sp.]